VEEEGWDQVGAKRAVRFDSREAWRMSIVFGEWCGMRGEVRKAMACVRAMVSELLDMMVFS
jgi:hypothetical protein